MGVHGPRASRRLVLVGSGQDATMVPSDDGPHVLEVVVFGWIEPRSRRFHVDGEGPWVEVEFRDVAQELRGAHW